VKNAKKSLTV